MEFTLPELFSVHCINHREPLLWVTIAATALLNLVLGLGAVRLALSARDVWRRVFYLGPFLLITFALASAFPFAAIHVGYRYLHSANVCIHFVWPALLLPLAVGLLSVIYALRDSRRRLPDDHERSPVARAMPDNPHP